MNYVYSPPAAPPIVPEWNDNAASRTQTSRASNSSSRHMHNANRLHLAGGHRKVNHRKNSAGNSANASAAVAQPMLQVPYNNVQIPEAAPVYNPLNNPIVQYYGQNYGSSPAGAAYYGMAQQ